MASIGIIGAGISGLTAAYRLHQAGHEPTVLEKSERAGGMIYSRRFDAPPTEGSYLVEFGPNSLRGASPLLHTLLSDLGLDEQRVEASPKANRRYVVFSGKPVALPGSVRELLSTELFSPSAKLRLLTEPFRGRADEEESVAAFARRRLGSEILDYGLNPFTAGVFAGDPEQLSVEHAFPRLHALERDHGSLVGGSIRRLAERLLHRLASSNGDDPADASRGPFSLRSGLQALPETLADRLGESVQYDAEVQFLHRTDGSRWNVHYNDGDESVERTFDAVVWTAPLPALLALTPGASNAGPDGSTLDETLGTDFSALRDVSYPPVSVVAMGFAREAVEHPLDGFGMLVPEAEAAPAGGCRTLGTLFSSSVFPHRAPEDHVLLTTFVGGTRDPDLAQASPDEISAAVQRDLRRLLGAHTPPSFEQRAVWPSAIPQYHVGYGRVKDAIDQIESDCPGLHLAGNYRTGVSVGDAAASGASAAQRVDERFG